MKNSLIRGVIFLLEILFATIAAFLFCCIMLYVGFFYKGLMGIVTSYGKLTIIDIIAFGNAIFCTLLVLFFILPQIAKKVKEIRKKGK